MYKIQYKNKQLGEGHFYDFYAISDGVNIVSIDKTRFEGFRITSVHKPDKKVGTGYQLDEYVPEEEVEERAIKLLNVSMPNWAYKSDYKHIKKYKDLNEFIKYQSQFFDTVITKI